MSQQTEEPEVSVVTDFLSQCLPFSALPQAQIRRLPAHIEVAYFRKGHTFHIGSKQTGLRIVRSGAVDILSDFDQLLDRLGEGESFNLEGLAQQQPGVRAMLIEDSLIYSLSIEHYQQLRKQYRVFDRFFHSQRSRRLRRITRLQPSPNALMRSVASVMSQQILSVAPGDTVRTAASLMSQHRVSSVLVMNEQRLCGIVTDRDLRSRVLARGLGTDTPVSSIMTAQPHVIEHTSSLFDATLSMTQHGHHHLPVVEKGSLVGIITASDLMLAKQSDPVYLVQHIGRQQQLQGIQGIVQSVPNLLIEWVNAGMNATQLCRILSAISDAVTTRLIELAIEAFGPAPVPFCWLGFGSQGRSEQLLGSDQDNGLLISDQLTEQHEAWFERLAGFVCDGLNACGYQHCPGKVMATSKQWRQSLSAWRSTVDRWTRTPTAEAVMKVSIFFDLRAVYGERALCQQLHQHMLMRTSQNSIFLAALAKNVLDHTPPLGIFRRFLVERNGEHRDTLDLKKRGVIPIVDIMRIHSLANNVKAISTQQRIAELARINVLTMSDSRNMQDALNFIMQLRVQEHAKQLSNNEQISNFCNPSTLAELERKHLRDAFTVVTESQEYLRRLYRDGL